MSNRLPLVLVLVGYAALALGHNLIVPVGESPDEPTHLEYVYYLRTERSLPHLSEPGGLGIVQGGHPPLYYALAAAMAAPWPPRPPHWRVNPHFSFNFAQPPAVNRYIHVGEPGFPYRGAPELAGIHAMRLLSLLAVLAAVWAVHAIAATVWPARPHLAWAAAAMAAFVPGMAFFGGVFNNDSLAMAFASLALLAAVRVALGRTSRRDLVLLGTLVGLGMLTKMTTASLAAIAALAILVDLGRRRDWRVIPRAIACGGGSALALCGWWIVRNVRLYGTDDPLAWRMFVRAGHDIVRTLPVRDEIGWYWRLQFESFWGSFGWTTVRLPESLYRAYGVLLLAALAGLVLLAARRHRLDDDARWGTLLLAAAAILGYASVFRLFLSFTNVVAHGRYLYPSLAPMAVLATVGIAELLPEAWHRRALAGLSTAMFVASAASLLWIARPAFATPRAVDPASIAGSGQAVDALYDGRLRLVRYALADDRLQAGRSSDLALYWQVPGDAKPSDPSASRPEIRFVHVLGADGEVVARIDGPPLDGALPATSFVPGEIYRDVVALPIDARAVTGAGAILVGWYPEGRPDARLGVSVNGQGSTDVYRIENVVIRPARPVTLPDDATERGDRLGEPPVARLAAYRIDGRLEPLSEFTVTLYWQAEAPVGLDQAVFVHLADSRGEPIATGDGRPQDGHYPMWLWSVGELVSDGHRVQVPSSGVPPGAALGVGWYDPAGGRRTPAWQADGSAWPDAAIVLPLAGSPAPAPSGR